MKRPAYTLMELTISVGVASLLIMGMSSALVVASKAVETPAATQDTQDSGDIVREFLEDSQHAIYILDHTDKVFEFALSDMDGDNQADIVKYEWSGVPGAPLYRSFNGGTQVAVAESVQSLDFEYLYRTTTETIPPALIQSNEELLTSVTGGSSESDGDVEHTKAWGQYFKPTFPNGITVDSWEITKVEVEIGKNGFAWGWSNIKIYPAAGSVPATNSLASQNAHESSLQSSPVWEDYTTAATNLDPNAAYCLVVKRGDTTSIKPALIRYQSGGMNMADHWMLESDDQGATWTTSTNKALHFKVWGKYLYSPAGSNTVTRRYLTGVRASLQLGASASTNLSASVPMLNTPETVENVWHLDFDEDPTGVDVNFDNTGDWTNGGTFDVNTLSGGIYSADATVLKTLPQNSVSQPITANVRMRAVSTGGYGAIFLLHYDQSGSNMCSLAANAVRNAEGTQTLYISRKNTNTTWQVLDSVPNLPAGFVDVRLVIVPSLDQVFVTVNGVSQGTFATPPIWEPTIHKYFSLSELDAQAEFDYVSIRIHDPN